MATPVYGKQFIRFAETGLVQEAVALDQFTLVIVNTSVPSDTPTIVQATGAGEIMGVLQQDVVVVDTDKATTLQRLGTVATSGLLLVANGTNAQSTGDALKVDANGKSDTSGGAVTCNGTTPIVRDNVTQGGVEMVLVSFS